ncbi:MAG: HAD family hydrolase [Candidatus Heimdallarchaeota archaeon]|nr:HAD family hydrolase [Candidatus Heimdallarchaeota archaeon]
MTDNASWHKSKALKPFLGTFSTIEALELMNGMLDSPITETQIPALLKMFQSKLSIAISQFIPKDPYGTFSYLRSLSKRFRLGILSDNSIVTKLFWQDQLIKHDLDVFDFFIVSEEVGVRKPHKKMFDVVIRVSNLEPEEIVYFGDNLSKDQAAEKFGMKFVHVFGFNPGFPPITRNSVRKISSEIEQLFDRSL